MSLVGKLASSQRSECPDQAHEILPKGAPFFASTLAKVSLPVDRRQVSLASDQVDQSPSDHTIGVRIWNSIEVNRDRPHNLTIYCSLSDWMVIVAWWQSILPG